MRAYAALVAASLAWAVTIVFIRGPAFQASPILLAPWQMLVGALFLLPWAALLEGPLPALPASTGWSLAFVGPISTAFAYWAAVEADRHVRANTTAMTLLATPCLGIILSALTLGEMVDTTLAVGALVVAAGIGLTLLSR